MIPNPRYKTVICKYWETNGTCPLGPRCHFSHGPEELRKLDPNFQFQNNMGMRKKQMGGGPTQSNYKTIKCKYFELNICKNGDSCTFAHGDKDLRPTVGRNRGMYGNNGYNNYNNNRYQNQGMSQQETIVKINQIRFIITELTKYYQDNEQVKMILNTSMNMLN